ncbi:MAG: class I SAM-dependent methyltransferase [Oscillochloridaceae bacterium umkhey_bin13]
MSNDTLNPNLARRLYGALGPLIGLTAIFERRAKALALAGLALAPGQQVLQVGVGTGVEQAALQRAVAPTGLVVGYDLTRRMLELTRRRVATPLCEGNVAWLPFADQQFDRVFSAYVLDLLPVALQPMALAELRRVLRPGGRLVLIHMTTGHDRFSQSFVAGWQLAFRLNPCLVGGCRPVQFYHQLIQAGLSVERQVAVELGFPSEVLIATNA